MELANLANAALSENDRARYVTLITEAFVYEAEAALSLISDFDSEPTRSVLFRSAAFMAYNVGNYKEAQKMVYLGLSGNPYIEIYDELLKLSDDILNSLSVNRSHTEAVAYTYMEILKQKAVNLKLEPKTERYEKAIVFDNITDLLKNVQVAFKNFCEVKFLKHFKVDDFPDFDSALSLFKKGNKMLCVNLEFKSFGIGIVADTTVMDYNLQGNSKFDVFKKSLFEEFQTEVLYPDYNSKEFQNMISGKYSDEERSKIYGTIVQSLDENSEYRVSITDKSFERIIKPYKAITKASKAVLKPKLILETNEEETNRVKKILNLTDAQGSKKSELASEFVDYVEFKISYQNISFENKKIYFIEPHEIKLVFNKGLFIIDDSLYDIYLEDKDHKVINKLYEKELVTKFFKLSTQEDWSLSERLLLEKMNASMIKDW
jgi:hypothetical protein